MSLWDWGTNKDWIKIWVASVKEAAIAHADWKKGMVGHFYGYTLVLLHTCYNVALSKYSAYFCGLSLWVI